MPVVIFFACLDFKQKSSIMDGRYVIFFAVEVDKNKQKVIKINFKGHK